MSVGLSVLFRCDGFSEIGLGHVFRCLALADEMSARGCRVAFAVKEGPLGARLIRQKGYTVFEPATGEEAFCQGQWLKDLVTDASADVLVLDVRDNIPGAALQELRDSGILIMTIDDPTENRLVADLAFYPPVPQVNVMDWTRFTGKLYKGWDWVILRREFAVNALKQRNKRPLVLVTMGGSDPAGLTLKTVEALNLIDEDFEAVIVLGPGFSHDSQLELLLASSRRQFDIRRNVNDMSDLMAKADIAVASFGVTAYELAAMGIPSVLMCLTEDHLESASAFVDAGIAVCAGIHTGVESASLAKEVSDLLADDRKRSSVANRAQLYVDGLGTNRIAQVIFKNATRKNPVIQWQGHRGPVLDSVNGFDVIGCESCGFKHIVPIPTLEELEVAYRSEYYSQEKPLYLERAREDLNWWNTVYGNRYDIFEQNLPLHRRRILDVGSGPGFFLLHGKKRGWQTLGIEPSKQAAAHSRELGLDIVEDFLTEQIAGGLGTFDVVHLSEVLEHVPDPASLLRLVFELLNPGGLACVIVPNDYSPFQEILRTTQGYHPWWVVPPHHINYFDFESMSRLLAGSGFEVILREATFPIDMFLLMGENYVGNDALGRQCHARRKEMEINLAQAGATGVRRALYQAIASAGIGREVLIVGMKT